MIARVNVRTVVSALIWSTVINVSACKASAVRIVKKILTIAWVHRAWIMPHVLMVSMVIVACARLGTRAQHARIKRMNVLPNLAYTVNVLTKWKTIIVCATHLTMARTATNLWAPPHSHVIRITIVNTERRAFPKATRQLVNVYLAIRVTCVKRTLMIASLIHVGIKEIAWIGLTVLNVCVVMVTLDHVAKRTSMTVRQTLVIRTRPAKTGLGTTSVTVKPVSQVWIVITILTTAPKGTRARMEDCAWTAWPTTAVYAGRNKDKFLFLWKRKQRGLNTPVPFYAYVWLHFV